MDLPLPDRPTIASVSPGRTLKLTPRSTGSAAVGYWKLDVAVLDLAARALERTVAARVLDRRVEHLEDALRRRDALLQRPGDVHQPPQRRRDQHQRRDERRERADGHPAGDRLDRAMYSTPASPTAAIDLHDRVAEALGQHQPHVRAAVLLDHLLEQPAS